MRGAMFCPRAAGAVIVGGFLAGVGCSPLRADATTGVELFRQNATAHAAPAAFVQELSDRIGPRPAGSENDRKAIAWALDKMKALGLQNVREEPVTVPHWVRGDEHAELLAPESQRLAITALGGSIETPEGGLEADVIEVPSLEAIEALSADDARRKIIFVNVPMERTRSDEGYSHAVPARAGTAVAAAKKGAAGAIIRSIATGTSRFPHTGYMRYDDAVPKIPVAALSVPDAMLLDRFIKAKKPVRIRMTVGGRSLPDAPSANVVGEIVGQEKPSDVVLIGAHLDSWDLGTGALEDGIFVREDWISEEGNEDIAKRFLKASFRGWVYCRDNADKCVDIVLAEGPTLGEGHQRWMMNEINKLIWPAPAGIGVMEPESWEVTKEIALDGKVIKQPASDDSYRTDIAEAADKELEDDGVDVKGEGWQPETVEVTEGGA